MTENIVEDVGLLDVIELLGLRMNWPAGNRRLAR